MEALERGRQGSSSRQLQEAPPGVYDNRRQFGSVKAWLQLARDGAIVRRACGYAVVVGAILIFINHGDALLSGDVDGSRIARMALTVFVPYVVSTLSSIGAMRALRR